MGRRDAAEERRGRGRERGWEECGIYEGEDDPQARRDSGRRARNEEMKFCRDKETGGFTCVVG